MTPKHCPFRAILSLIVVSGPGGVITPQGTTARDVAKNMVSCTGDQCAIYDGSRRCCGMIARAAVEVTPVRLKKPQGCGKVRCEGYHPSSCDPDCEHVAAELV